MPPVRQWLFAPFRLDLDNACLWREAQMVALKPKTFAVLQYLVEHAGRLVTKEELFDAVWPNTAVGDAVLKVCIGDLRKALGESARTPQFIATMHRRGYRFLASVAPATSAPTAPGSAPNTAARLSVGSAPPLSLVGRERVLDQLHAWLDQAAQGHRHVVLVTGEPGIGKTAVVEAFTAQAVAATPVRLAWGQCVAQYGAGEPYLPVLEALGQLCRDPEGAEVVAVLRQQAPTWLVQMPWLLTMEDRERLSQELQGMTRERMLREFAELVETLTTEIPLLLVLEDLHWSDHATLDLLALLARRRAPARLLLLGTYRPVELIVQNHPLRTVAQDLEQHGHGTVLPLPLLDVEAVAAYLVVRFPKQRFPGAFAAWVHQHTDGNPLFLVTLVETLMAREVLREDNGHWQLRGGLEAVAIVVPEGLRLLLEQQLGRLPPEGQQVLEVASVAGVVFATAAVAAGLEADVEQIERRCERLVLQQVLRPVGLVTWPDGTVVARYEFTHALYQQVAYGNLGAGRRVQLHRRLGARLEAAYATQVGEIAAELAVHFEQGRDHQRAVQDLQHAAERAGQRHAHREAIEYLRRALALLKTMPETPPLLGQELAVQLALGPALMVTKGFAAPEAADTYTRAHQLCVQLGDREHLFPVLFGLWRSAHVRAQLQTARTLGEQLLSLANTQGDPALFVEAHGPLGQTLCIQGELMLAREHLQQVVALYEPHRHRPLALRCGYDPGVYARAMEGWVLWLLGYPEQALRGSHDALQLAREQAHPFTLSLTLATVAVLQQMRREGDATLEHVQDSVVLSTEHGFPYLRAVGTVLQGWGLASGGQVRVGMAQMHAGLAALRGTGAEVFRPYLLALLAEVCGRDGQIEAGLSALEEALVAADKHAEHFYEAELHRLQGELLLRQSVGAGRHPDPRDVRQGPAAGVGAADQSPLQMEAEAAFQRALDITRRQRAKSLELRTTLSLSRLWQYQGKRTEARALLAPIYGWFTEGFDTADLQEAKALLEEMV